MGILALWGGMQVWFFNDVSRRWEQEPHPLSGHTDWVRDVGWAPSLGLPVNTIASVSQVGPTSLSTTACMV